MATVITHIYNEEQLLPLWLEHHSKYFDRGIIVDFNSNDKSKKIISNYPNFEIYNSKIDIFSATALDSMMIEFEKGVEGIRIVLNVTEFLLGDPNTSERDFLIPSVSLVNMSFDEEFDWSKQFWEQRSYGVSYETFFQLRRSRILAHNLPEYPLGRHFETIDSGGYLIVHVANCLVNDGMFNRRLQIQNKIPIEDKNQNLGFQHYRAGRDLTKDDLLIEQENYRKMAVNVSSLINNALTIR